MGRHSAPDDGDEVDVAPAAVLVDVPPEESGEISGRHARIRIAPPEARPLPPEIKPPPSDAERPQSVESPPEEPGERTSRIPTVEADRAAGTDSELAPIVGVRAAELEPILPGEAVVPPPVEDLDELDQLLQPPEDTAADETGLASDEIAPLPLADAAAPAPEDVAAPTPRPSKETLLHRGAHASAADLALLRSNGSLRARCIAGFLVPYVLYVVVLIVVGAARRDYLLWIWVPTIIGCVAAGSLLDVAHRDVVGHPDVPVAPPSATTGPIEAIADLDVSPAELTSPLAPIVLDGPDVADGLDATEPAGGDDPDMTAETHAVDDAEEPTDSGGSDDGVSGS